MTPTSEVIRLARETKVIPVLTGGPKADYFKLIEDFAARLISLAKEEALAEGWQPIETAPKDGTSIIGWHAKYGARETKMNFYGEGSQGYADHMAGKGPLECGWDWSEPKNGWGFSWEPTHWRPLPPPPKEAP
ncbi:hypothetical protein [Curvibacter lanceolatus]|uniref:hypothetical protein n=1 Tax=Curvibacter lanceolatus TaxID=86182 RepID=UPI00035CA57F|nr:hypothetical protein [Curvibacter lanceolatus]